MVWIGLVRGVDRLRLEQDVRALSKRGDHVAAATLALGGYGPEILGFLIAVHQNEADASEAFSEFSEVVWRKLPAFTWEATLRTWAYAVARNVSRALHRNASRRGRRAGAAGDSVLEGIAQAVRSETLTYLRTEMKTRLQALRDQLPEEDRMLVVLRVDRGLEWNELARVLGEAEGDTPIYETALAREAARLRKRFQLVKDKLRELARREGLVE
jgi:RNA polymerase sigma-70 factor (ECF subfamily)